MNVNFPIENGHQNVVPPGLVEGHIEEQLMEDHQAAYILLQDPIVAQIPQNLVAIQNIAEDIIIEEIQEPQPLQQLILPESQTNLHVLEEIHPQPPANPLGAQ
jgi:hypothetical protein